MSPVVERTRLPSFTCPRALIVPTLVTTAAPARPGPRHPRGDRQTILNVPETVAPGMRCEGAHMCHLLLNSIIICYGKLMASR